MRTVTLLGATGSVGLSTLAVLRSHPRELALFGVTAHRKADALAAIVREFRPALAALVDEKAVTISLREACRDAGATLLVGADSSRQVAAEAGGDIVLAAIVGAAGLPATAAAVARGAVVALANKESLVVAGEVLTRDAARSGATLLPVDSEHAAIHQCLRAGRSGEARRLILTASGGPFRTRPLEQFQSITLADALRHPTWKMGAKITLDSATLMNKGLELIEAHWLFDFPDEALDVVIHPQSIVHSLVEFRDGNVLAQLNLPDMRDPIRYCLTWPERWDVPGPPFDLASVSPLSFEKPDAVRYPCLGLARAALRTGGTATAVLNAANEVATAALLEERIHFLDIAAVVEETLARLPATAAGTLDSVLAADAAAREAALGFVAARTGR